MERKKQVGLESLVQQIRMYTTCNCLYVVYILVFEKKKNTKLQPSRHVYLSTYLSTCLFIQLYSLSSVKNVPTNAGDLGSIPGSGRFPGEEMVTTPAFLSGKSYGLRSLMNYSLWIPQSQTQLSDTTTEFFPPIGDSLMITVKNNNTDSLSTYAIFHLGMLQ